MIFKIIPLSQIRISLLFIQMLKMFPGDQLVQKRGVRVLSGPDLVGPLSRRVCVGIVALAVSFYSGFDPGKN